MHPGRRGQDQASVARRDAGVITHLITDSGFAFVFLTVNLSPGSIVYVYDLDRVGPALPSDPGISGSFLGSFLPATLRDSSGALDFTHVQVPAAEMKVVREFLTLALADLEVS